MSTTGSDKNPKPTEPVVEPEPATDDDDTDESTTDTEASPDKRTWQ